MSYDLTEIGEIIPSDLVLLAVKNKGECETDLKYLVDMDKWHIISKSGELCYVCFAGCVMVKTCGMPWKSILLSDINSKTLRRQFRAISAFMEGDIKYAFCILKVSMPVGLPCLYNVAEYCKKPEQFDTDMNNMILLLQEYGV